MNIARQFKKTGRSAASKTKTLDLKLIRVDGGTQSRAGIDDAVVETYAEDIADGVTFPPITVFHDGAEYWLADGFHRYRAHQQARKAKIAVEIRQGTRRDAILYSVGANGTHGLRRTNEDKRRAVLTLLGDTEWSTKPETWIAGTCKVSRALVRAVISDNPHLVEKQDRTADREVVRGGTTYVMNTAAIGNSGQPEVSASENLPTQTHAAEATAQPANSANLQSSAPEEDHSAFHQQAQESLPQAIRDIEAAKQQAIALRKDRQDHNGLSSEDRIAELEEAVRVLEAEAQELRAENKKYGEMRVQFEQGGFEKVVADKDEEIRVLLTRVEQESAEKVRNLRRGDHFLKILNDNYNHFKDAVVDPATGETSYV